MRSVIAAMLGLAILVTAGCEEEPGATSPGFDTSPTTERGETAPGFDTSPTQDLVPGEITTDGLYGRTFTADSVSGDAATEALMAKVPFVMNFNGFGSVGVRANCDTLGVLVSIDDNGVAELEFNSTTEKPCEDSHMAQDEWLAEFFTSTPQQWSWDGSLLTLTYLDTTVTLTQTGTTLD